MNNSTACLHAFVEGYVQGVGYRSFVLYHARSLGLMGWVRNTRKNEVEVTAEGNSNALEDLLGILSSGPANAVVTNVRQEWLEASGNFSDFELFPTV